MTEPRVTFAGVLRKLRSEARLTQEELAEATGLSPRSISDLERGIASTPRRDTVRLLADALHLTGQAQAEFEAIARGRTVADGAGAAGAGTAGAGTDGAAAATRTLPRDIASFTGRQQELQDLVDAAASSGGVVGIHAIGGMAGVGKTAFAVHAAYRLAPRFPAGQIFLSLHGHTPGQQPVDPGDALASLLLSIGVPAAQIPSGVEARMALWRDRLAGKQLLLVLDDAASSEQVRPLLPGSGGNLVLVTSRRHLSALEDLAAISLDTLPSDEAAGLLVRLAGRAGLSVADPAVGQIVELCGFLPLAIGMVARQLHHHPSWSLAGRAAELAAAVDRLELMATENLSVAAAFNLSYEELTSGQQRLFRRLGLHPGADIDAYAAAALDDTDLAAARRGLEGLYDQYLLTEPAAGRYRLHDLIREHARALAGQLDQDRDQVTDRLLDYYQYTAAVAESRLTFAARPALACAAVAEPAVVPALPGRKQALAWVRAERANLFACLDYVTAASQHARVIALTFGLGEVLYNDGPWAESLARQVVALHAAQRLGDQAAQANVLNELGNLRMATGDYPSAAQPLEEALAIYRDLDDRYGQAYVLGDLAVARKVNNNYPSAMQVLEESLRIRREIGDRAGEACALSGMGSVRQMAGDYPGAARALEESLVIFREFDSRLPQAGPLVLLGVVRLATGDYPGAAQVLEESLAIRREIGDRSALADVLCNLAEVWRLAGDYPAAAGALEEALAIDRERGYRLGEANARTLLGILRRTTGDYSKAAQLVGEGLGIYRAIGDRGGEVTALNESGTLHRLRGDVPQATSCHEQALDLAREIGSSWDEAHALAGLGRCALATGRAAEAEQSMRQALEIFQQIGAAEVTDLTAELDALTKA